MLWLYYYFQKQRQAVASGVTGPCRTWDSEPGTRVLAVRASCPSVIHAVVIEKLKASTEVGFWHELVQLFRFEQKEIETRVIWMSSLKTIRLVSGRAKDKHRLEVMIFPLFLSKQVPWHCLYVMEERPLESPQSTGCWAPGKNVNIRSDPSLTHHCLCNEGDRCPVGQGWSSWQEHSICLEHASPLDKYRISGLRTTCSITLWF